MPITVSGTNGPVRVTITLYGACPPERVAAEQQVALYRAEQLSPQLPRFKPSFSAQRGPWIPE